MKNSSQNLLPVKKINNIVEMIKNKIKKIFSKKEKIAPKYEVQNDAKENFDERIKYVDEYETERILEIKLDRNEINVSDLTNLEKEKMITYYRKQIKIKKDKIESIKNKILKDIKK